MVIRLLILLFLKIFCKTLLQVVELEKEHKRLLAEYVVETLEINEIYPITYLSCAILSKFRIKVSKFVYISSMLFFFLCDLLFLFLPATRSNFNWANRLKKIRME